MQIQQQMMLELADIPKPKLFELYDLIHYFKSLSEKESVVDVKNKKLQEGFKFNNNGTFCTLDIEESKIYVASMSEKISYKELLLPHCGIFHRRIQLASAIHF